MVDDATYVIAQRGGLLAGHFLRAAANALDSFFVIFVSVCCKGVSCHKERGGLCEGGTAVRQAPSCVCPRGVQVTTSSPVPPFPRSVKAFLTFTLRRLWFH